MFTFKQFSIDDKLTAMKVGTDGVLLGAWAAGGERILDVGTGSGVIALMMAERFPDADVVGIDIDEDSCEQASQNVKHSAFVNRINILHSSLQDFAKSYNGERFDSIVSNPPFFKNSLKSPDSKRTLVRHDSSLTFRELISCSKVLLKENGKLSVIAPYNLKDDIESEAIINCMSVYNIVNIRTKTNKPFSRIMVTVINGYASEHNEADVLLYDDGGQRSVWYKSLTKDFYIR